MDDLEGSEQVRENAADRVVDCDRAKASADHEKNRFVGGKSAEIQGGELVSGAQFLADRGSGYDSFARRKIGDRLRKVAADLRGSWDGQLVCESRCHVGFVDDHGDMQLLGCLNHRDGHKAALGKDDIRPDFLEHFFRLEEALYHAERICEIFQIKVAAQLSGCDTVIGDAEFLDQLFFDSVVRADILYFVAELPELWKQGDIRCHMSGGSSAGENDSLHEKIPARAEAVKTLQGANIKGEGRGVCIPFR